VVRIAIDIGRRGRSSKFHPANTPLWIHGEFLRGNAGELFVDEHIKRTEFRAGLELRECTGGGHVCAIAGVDGALQHTRTTGSGVNSFEVTSADPVMTTEATNGLAIARVGLDLGGHHLRYGPGFELGLDKRGYQSAELVQSIAWTF